MALAKLSIDLEARLATLQTDLDKANRLIGQQTEAMTGRFQAVQRAATAVGAAFAGALSVGTVAAFVRRTVDSLAALKGLSEATGASVENLSALESVALRSGTSVEGMSTALVRFNQELTKADKGSETAAIFRQIGLEAEQLRQLDPAEALRRVSVALAGYADDGDRARIVQQLFGRNVREVAGFLRDLAEQQQLQATATTEQVEAADRLTKQFARLGESAQALGRAVAEPLISGLSKLLEYFERATARGKTLGERLQALWQLSTRLSGIGLLDYALTANRDRLAEISARLTEIEQVRARLDNYVSKRGETPAAKAQIERLDAEKRALVDERNSLIRQFLNSEQGYGQGGVPLPGVGRPRGTGSGGAARQERTGVLAGVGISRSLQDALSAVDQTQIAQVERLRAALGELFSLRASGLGPDAGLDAAIQDLRDRLAELDPAQRQAAENQRRLNELLASTPSGQLAAVTREIEFVNQAYAGGKISVEQWAELQRQATARLPQQLAESLDEMSEITKQFQRNVQDSLGRTFSQTLRGEFETIGELWKNLLIDMAAQAAAADIGNRLFGDKASGGSNGGWFGAFMQAIGFARGGVFGAGQPVTAFADGGILTRATPFMYGGGRLGVAGEAGPEAVLPLRRGRDGKLGVAGGGGLTVINNVQAGVSRGELVAALQMSSQETYARVMRELRTQRVM